MENEVGVSLYNLATWSSALAVFFGRGHFHKLSSSRFLIFSDFDLSCTKTALIFERLCKLFSFEIILFATLNSKTWIQVLRIVGVQDQESLPFRSWMRQQRLVVDNGGCALLTFIKQPYISGVDSGCG